MGAVYCRLGGFGRERVRLTESDGGISFISSMLMTPRHGCVGVGVWVRYDGKGSCDAAKMFAVCRTWSSCSETSSCDARILLVFSHVFAYAASTSVDT
jgi:hypothetical protein